MAEQNLKWRSGALAASGFGLGKVAGLFLRKAAEIGRAHV